MQYRRLSQSLALLTSMLATSTVRADGGELLLGANYAPSISQVRAADAPWTGRDGSYAFDHVVGLDVVYALSNRIGVGLGGQLLWPQDFVAQGVDWRDRGGQVKQDATVHLRELQLSVGGLLALKTDRRQVWDLALTVGAGLQATRWGARDFTVQRAAGPQTLADGRARWIYRPVYHASPTLSWRLGQHALVAAGPRLDVTQGGTLRVSAVAQVAVPLPLGPSF